MSVFEIIEGLLSEYDSPSFERPSAIQQRAIVPVVKGHDVIAQAQSGTGKTATFSISILQQVSSDAWAVSCQLTKEMFFFFLPLVGHVYQRHPSPHSCSHS